MKNSVILLLIIFCKYTFPATENTYFYIKDHLGSTRAVINRSDGEVVEAKAYYPYGKEMDGLGGLNNDTKTSETFTGKEKDEDTELYYFGARYYDAELGMFIGRDPMLEFHNPFSYTNGNPIILIDPNGLDSYVFYDPYEFEDQAYAQKDVLSKEYETETHLIPISTKDEFNTEWDKLSQEDDVDAIALLFHGRGGQLYSTDPEDKHSVDEVFSLSTIEGGQSPVSEDVQGIDIREIEKVDAKRIDILSCHGAEAPKQEQYRDSPSLQMAFYRKLKNNNGYVTGWYGKLGYDWVTFEPRNSKYQGGFKTIFRDKYLGKKYLPPYYFIGD